MTGRRSVPSCALCSQTAHWSRSSQAIGTTKLAERGTCDRHSLEPMPWAVHVSLGSRRSGPMDYRRPAGRARPRAPNCAPWYTVWPHGEPSESYMRSHFGRLDRHKPLRLFMITGTRWPLANDPPFNLSPLTEFADLSWDPRAAIDEPYLAALGQPEPPHALT